MHGGAIAGLTALERLVFGSRLLQRFVIATHERAMRPLVDALDAPPRRVAIVGGGLFPRTAIVLRQLLPDAHLTIIDANRAHLDRARGVLNGNHTAFVHAWYAPAAALATAYDLVVIPLSYVGDRAELYDDPPAAAMIVHDWIWRKRGLSRIVSLALLKRVNLLTR
jgi:hypothetical protein